MRQYIVSQASFPWDVDLINPRVFLVGVRQEWELISGEPPSRSSICYPEEIASVAIKKAEILKWSGEHYGYTDRYFENQWQRGAVVENLEYARQLNEHERLSMCREAGPGGRI